MIQRTYGQVKDSLAKVAGAAGMPVTDARLIEVTNRAVEELMNEGEFPGVVDRWALRTVEGLVTLPYHLDRIMQVCVNDYPREIRSPWYEFVQYGPGQQYETRASDGAQKLWSDVVMDRGEVRLAVPIPDADGPWALRVYPQIDERVDGVYPTVNIQGLNADGDIVNTLSNGTAGPCSIGDTLQLVQPPGYVQSVSDFTTVDAFIKPETCGYLTMKAWNGVTEVEVAKYAPAQTVCSFRQYLIPAVVPSLNETSPVPRYLLARCRRRFVPVTEDNDVLIIGNLPALREMVVALWKRDSDAWDDYAAHKQSAVTILTKEAMGYLGKAVAPAVTFQRGIAFGAGLPFVR